MRKVAFFLWLVLMGYLLWTTKLGQTALVVVLVAVPTVVLAVTYPVWRETGAPARELAAFWLMASFLGVFPVFVKVFLMLAGGPLAVGELTGGLAGLAYFLVTLLRSAGRPLATYLPSRAIPLVRAASSAESSPAPATGGRPQGGHPDPAGLPVGEGPGGEGLVAALEEVAARARVKVAGVYAVPRQALTRGPVEFAGLGTTNLYLAEEAVRPHRASGRPLTPAEAAFLVGAELWRLRHKDLWWNLAVYYGWLVFVGFHRLWGWATVAVAGGVMFSVLWPLASRLKQLAADRYAVRLTRDPRSALDALLRLPDLWPQGQLSGAGPGPAGWRTLALTLFRYEVPLGLRVQSLRFARVVPRGGEEQVRRWSKEGLGFTFLQVLLLLGVIGVLLVPGFLERRGLVDEFLRDVLYLALGGLLYVPCTLCTLDLIYRTFLAPGDEGAPRRRLPIWAVGLTVAAFALALAATWLLALKEPRLVEAAMAASAGFLLAGLVAGEIEAISRGPTARCDARPRAVVPAPSGSQPQP
jgi:hypothetical protein